MYYGPYRRLTDASVRGEMDGNTHTHTEITATNVLIDPHMDTVIRLCSAVSVMLLSYG